MRATLSISVQPDPAKPPTQIVQDIPWYPGITVLQAMVLADALTEATFSFRAVYASLYGAFIDKINGVEDQGNDYWMLYIDQQEAKVGVSEAVLIEQPGQNIEIEWKYESIPLQAAAGSQLDKKIKALGLA